MESEAKVSRREFLRSGIASSASLGALGGISIHPQRVWGANDRVRMAVVGVRGRGGNHIKGFGKVPDAETAAICDVDDAVISKRLDDMAAWNLPKPKVYKDVRKLLEDKSIDAISVATPNHWHSLMGIWACQAGKDTYVEKPCSRSGWEGHQLVAAARR
jgi:predicted dehydrogenase